MNAVLHTIELAAGNIFRMSLEATFLILLVLAIRRVFRRQLSPSARYCLWLLVVIRMLMPILPQCGLSLFNLPGLFTGEGSTSLPVSVVEETPEPPALTTQAAPAHSEPLGPWRITVGIWLAGLLISAISVFLGSWRYSAEICQHRPVTKTRILDLLEDCKEELGLHLPVGLVLSKSVQSPVLFGALRPKILLPDSMIGTFSSEELRYVFLHELGHIKRHDIAVNWLVTFVQVVHWFNPLAWLAFARMRADREEACDALVLSRSQTPENVSYGDTILRILQEFSSPQTIPPVAGILEQKNEMKNRIEHIAHYQKRPRTHTLVAAAILTCASLIGLTQAHETASSEPPAIRQAKLIRITHVEFKEKPFIEVIQYVSQFSSPHYIPHQIEYRGGADAEKLPRINLLVHDASLYEILRDVAVQAGLELQGDQESLYLEAPRVKVTDAALSPDATLPLGLNLPGSPGFVISPHSLSGGVIDVRDEEPGAKVQDPFAANKFFRVPPDTPKINAAGIPVAVPAPGLPGFVISPHTADREHVDVRGFPPGQEVRCPFTGKLFLVP